MGELGDLLRKTREEKGLSLVQAEEATRIRHAYLQALEEEAFDRLPAAVYVKGFLKNYALFLGLDASTTLELYHPISAQGSPQPAPTFLNEPLTPHPGTALLMRWAGPILLILCLAAAGWLAFDRWGDRINLHWPFFWPSASPTLAPTATPTATLVALTATPISPTPTPEPTMTPAPTETPRPIQGLNAHRCRGEARLVDSGRSDDQPAFAGHPRARRRRYLGGPRTHLPSLRQRRCRQTQAERR